MNEHPGIRWQPPSERDLKRFPPAGAACAEFRTMLRDYADGDLPRPQRRAVEHHVHECRDCALALSRAEHETLRLRRALSGPAPAAPADLTERVLARILAGDEQPAAEEPVARKRRGVPLPLAVVFAAAAMVLGALLVLQPWRDGRSAPRVTVESAQDTWLEEGTVARRIERNETLSAGGVVRVDREGGAVLVLAAGDAVPGSEADHREVFLTVGSDSRLALAEVPVLQQGVVAVRSGRLLELGLRDGTRVELGRGSYHLEAIGFRSFDSGLRSEPTGIRVRLEVLDGDAARITRPGTAPVEVAPQQVARYSDWAPLEIEPSLDADRSAVALRAAGTPPAATTPGDHGLPGSVVDARGNLPVVAAHVRLEVAGSTTEHRVDTDTAGRFRVPVPQRSAGGHVLVSVSPPEGDPDLGLLPARPVPLVERDGVVTVPALPLRPVPPIPGTVRDREYRWLPGAGVVPMLLDELTGTLEPLEELARTVGPDGDFVLRGLPVELAPYQSLVLVAAHELGGTACEPIPDPELAGATGLRIELVLAAETRQLEGLPAEEDLRVAERLDTGQGLEVVRFHDVQTDFAGRASVRVSTDEVFVVGQDGVWVPLVAGGGAGEARGPLSPAPDAARQGPALAPVPGLQALAIQVRGGSRYAAGLPGPGGPQGAVAVVEEGNNRRVPGAEVFALQGSGRPLRLRGIAGSAAVGVAADDPGLVGVGPGGSLGLLSRGPEAGVEASLPLVAAGAVEMAAELREGVGSAPLRLVLSPREGPFADLLAGRSLVRFAGTPGGWTTGPIPAGAWVVTLPDGQERQLVVEPGRISVLR